MFDKRMLPAILLFFLIIGCGSQATPEPIPITDTTSIPDPTPTPTEDIMTVVKKSSVVDSIMQYTNTEGTNIYCKSVTWENDLIKLKCDLLY